MQVAGDIENYTSIPLMKPYQLRVIVNADRELLEELVSKVMGDLKVNKGTLVLVIVNNWH